MAAEVVGVAPWARSSWTDAAQLAAVIDPESVPAAAAGRPLHEWYGELVATGRLLDAVRFLAQALPRYEATVWAAQALLSLAAIERTNPAIIAALRWIDEPGDAGRRAAAEAGEALKDGTPAKLLTQAVLLSGGSLAPPDLQPIQPPPDACNKVCAAAVLTAAYDQPDPDAALRQALALGEAMVTGR
ncbi:MAG: hypothetical protein JF593_13755 [Novosphingobium sp.]|nr:hypothetical protein [Novosphingobium sp.]